MNSKPILKGYGIRLRHASMRDLKEYHTKINDKSTAKGFLSLPYPCPLSHARKELKATIRNYWSKRPTRELFIIEVDGEIAGDVSIGHLSYKYHKHKGEVGYWVARKFRGRGIATKAVKLLTPYAFKKYKLKRIQGTCRTFNKASARVLEKAGYKLEGILRKNKCKDGRYLDDMIFAKIK